MENVFQISKITFEKYFSKCKIDFKKNLFQKHVQKNIFQKQNLHFEES